MAPKKKKNEPEEQSMMEKISSYLVNPFRSLPPPKTPITDFGERVKNMLKNNFRGLLGVIVPIIALGYKVNRFNAPLKLWLMWQWMAWFYLVHPIAVPCSSLIPIFVLPMCGVYDSSSVCKCYMNEAIMLYITSAYVLVLLNNSGLDKRICLWFLCLGGNNTFTGKMLVLKASTAAFFLSMLSNRLITTHNLTQWMTDAFEKTKPTLDVQLTKSSPDRTSMCYVINNAIQTSASIGGLGIIHSSWVTLTFRACYQECVPKHFENPDIFNYLQYSAFAFPVAFIMFIVNMIYHMGLMTTVEGSGIGEMQQEELKNILSANKDQLPEGFTMHEVYSAVFTVLLYVALFTRNNRFMSGWAFPVENLPMEPMVLRVKDATVTAIFVIILHVIPKGFDFLKLFIVTERCDLPPKKPESAILFWRFVDKNVNYGYMFTIGSAVALLRAGFKTEVNLLLNATWGIHITKLSWAVSLLICIVIAAVLCNIMTGMASISIFLPYIMLLAEISQIPWPTHYFLPALGIGLASNLGFCVPFRYSPAYYCHHTGKVPILRMVKYSIPAVVIGALIIFLGVYKYAPMMLNPDNTGISRIAADAEGKKSLNDKLKDSLAQAQNMANQYSNPMNAPQPPPPPPPP
ncbi:hypothetical protein PYW08_016461 [Mythimna loreyi]|uniref:Uncharacterized protein n=1 Tax=Mythimna loreyi TaxID=667449 RepID=A0ACC2QXM9_9NEOP|nr:hypothetical protein PYW08_016461 [Mythimna loreyi]